MLMVFVDDSEEKKPRRAPLGTQAAGVVVTPPRAGALVRASELAAHLGRGRGLPSIPRPRRPRRRQASRRRPSRGPR